MEARRAMIEYYLPGTLNPDSALSINTDIQYDHLAEVSVESMIFLYYFANILAYLKPWYSIGGFESISINLSNSAAFSLQTSESSIKPP